jgi:hypothetical protein
MSHDTDERLDGLDDALRERLNRLGRSATAGSVPWPGVDRAIRRRRRTSALRTGAVAVAVAALGGSTAVALPRLLGGGPTTPTAASVEGSYVPEPPWRVPTAGFTPLYENVQVRLATSACGQIASINFREPTKVGTASVPRTDQRARGDLGVGRPCVQPHLTSVGIGVPTLVTSFDGPGLPTAADCVRDVATRKEALPPDTGYGFSSRRRNGPDAGDLTRCAVLPADPGTGEPAAVVAVHLVYVDEGVVDATLSAWTGTDEVEVALTGGNQTSQQPPEPTMTGPFRERYGDVELHLPGKPEVCTGAAAEGTYLELHVPEVSEELAPSDAALTPPCPGPGAAALQLGTARGVVLRKTRVSAAECATALGSGTKVDTFEPVEGTTLCIVSPALEELRLPAVLVALTVTKVDARTGAFDLSATGWTGKAG